MVDEDVNTYGPFTALEFLDEFGSPTYTEVDISGTVSQHLLLYNVRKPTGQYGNLRQMEA